MRNWGSSMHHDDKGTFAAQEVDQQLQECVYGEGFVDVAERIEVKCGFQRDNRGP